MADLQRGGVTRRSPWWFGGVAFGALLGGTFAALHGAVLGFVFVVPFAAARGRAGAAIAGGLLGAGVAAIVVHGIGMDLNTAAAAVTLAAGLVLSGIALSES